LLPPSNSHAPGSQTHRHSTPTLAPRTPLRGSNSPPNLPQPPTLGPRDTKAQGQPGRV
jgi:hypothetical protein